MVQPDPADASAGPAWPPRAHPVVVVMAGHLGDLPAAVAAGKQPNIELIELTARHGVPLSSYEDLDRAGWFLRVVARLLGPHIALALWSVGRFRNGETLIATGEDVGLPMALAHGVLRRRRRRPRVAIIGHGSFLNSGRVRVLGTLLRRRRDVAFLPLASSLSNMLVTRAGLRADQVWTIGFGTDTRFFAPVERARSDRVQVASAGLATRDYRTLVEAMDGIDGEVTIAADSAWFRSPLDLDLDALPTDVEVRSFGDYVGLRGLYERSDVVVVPLRESRHACGYAVIAEAMAMGLPVIATRASGHSDLIDDGVTGWYVPPGDAAALRERIRAVVDDPDLARAVELELWQHMVDRDSVELFADRIVSAAVDVFAAAPSP